MVHVLLQPNLENFKHYFTTMWDECSCAVVLIGLQVRFLCDPAMAFRHLLCSGPSLRFYLVPFPFVEQPPGGDVFCAQCLRATATDLCGHRKPCWGQGGHCCPVVVAWKYRPHPCPQVSRRPKPWGHQSLDGAELGSPGKGSVTAWSHALIYPVSLCTISSVYFTVPDIGRTACIFKKDNNARINSAK